MEPEDSRLLSMQEMWLRYTLCVSKKRRNTTVTVNAVNFEPSALVGVRIRHLDGAASWKILD